MKVTKQHKILGGVLVLGMVLVGVDHFTRGASEPAAEAASDYQASQPQAKPAAIAAAPVKLTGPSIAQRLRNSGRGYADHDVNDAFAMGVVWHPEAKSQAAGTSARTDISEQQFRQMHHLTGTLTSAGNALAMVDGKIIAVGRDLDGFKLVSISHRSATFECGQSKIVLNLNERSGAAMAGVSE